MVRRLKTLKKLHKRLGSLHLEEIVVGGDCARRFVSGVDFLQKDAWTDPNGEFHGNIVAVGQAIYEHAIAGTELQGIVKTEGIAWPLVAEGLTLDLICGSGGAGLFSFHSQAIKQAPAFRFYAHSFEVGCEPGTSTLRFDIFVHQWRVGTFESGDRNVKIYLVDIPFKSANDALQAIKEYGFCEFIDDVFARQLPGESDWSAFVAALEELSESFYANVEDEGIDKDQLPRYRCGIGHFNSSIPDNAEAL